MSNGASPPPDRVIFSRREAGAGAYQSNTCSACQPRNQAHQDTSRHTPISARHILGTAVMSVVTSSFCLRVQISV